MNVTLVVPAILVFVVIAVTEPFLLVFQDTSASKTFFLMTTNIAIGLVQYGSIAALLMTGILFPTVFRFGKIIIRKKDEKIELVNRITRKNITIFMDEMQGVVCRDFPILDLVGERSVKSNNPKSIKMVKIITHKKKYTLFMPYHIFLRMKHAIPGHIPVKSSCGKKHSHLRILFIFITIVIFLIFYDLIIAK